MCSNWVTCQAPLTWEQGGPKTRMQRAQTLQPAPGARPEAENARPAPIHPNARTACAAHASQKGQASKPHRIMPAMPGAPGPRGPRVSRCGCSAFQFDRDKAVRGSGNVEWAERGP